MINEIRVSPQLIASNVALDTPINGHEDVYQALLSFLVSQHFSYKRVASDESLLIPSFQQMLLRGHFLLSGALVLEGEVAFV